MIKVRKYLVDLLTNPNSRFRAIENSGGDSGSHLHLLGVHDSIFQHFLRASFCNILENLVLEPEPELVVDVEAAAPSTPASSGLSS